MAKSERLIKAPRRPVRIDEVPGMTGLRRPDWRGWVDEEFNRDLRGGIRAIKIYTEMAADDTVGACLGTIKSTLRNVKWSAQGGDDERKEFIEQCFADFNWADAFSEILSMLDYGWAWLVPGFKRRGGMTDDPLTSSKFKDGKIGWSGWFPRSQDSWSEWQWDERGQLTAMVQQPPPRYEVITIPLQQSLHFRTTAFKDNPEGRSLLRTAFRPWKFKQNLETIEAIGMERDLAGLPFIKRDEVYKSLDDTFRDLLRRVRRDENEGIIIPMVRDANGKDLIEFGLLSSAGARQFDSDKVITRKQKQIALAIHTDFILLGHEAVGSFALSDSKTSIYSLVCGGFLYIIGRIINDFAIPRLLMLNAKPVEDAPQWKHGDIETADLKSQGDFLGAYTSAGGEAFPDPDLDAHFRNMAGWPQKSEETMRMQEDRREEAASQFAPTNEEEKEEEGTDNGGTGDDTAE